MTTPDLRSLTSGAANFSEEIDEAERIGVPWRGHPITGESTGTGEPRGTLTIDRELPPVSAAPKSRKGPAWRLSELRASSQRLAMRRGTP